MTEEKDSGSNQVSSFSQLVKHLSISLRSTKAYPSGHPHVQKMLGETYDLLGEIMGGRDEVTICVFEDSVMIEDNRIDSSVLPAVTAFIAALKKIDVRSISFYRGFTLDQVRNLFSILSMDKVSLAKSGGVATSLRDRGVEGIKLNEVEFGIISKKEKQEVKGVVLSLETFESLLATPHKLFDKLAREPGEVADLITQVGGEGLPTMDRALKNMEKIASSISEAYGPAQKVDYAKKLTELVEAVKAPLRERVKEPGLDAGITRVVGGALGDVSDGDLASTVVSKYSEFRGLPSPELKGEMREFMENLPVSPERKSSLFPVVKEKLLDEGCAEDDILAILEEEDQKTFEHLCKDPQWLLRETSSHPEEVGDLLATVGDPSLPNVDRVVANLEEAAASISRLYGQEERAEYAKQLAEFVSTIQPIVRDRLAEKKEFDEKIANVVGRAIGDLSDEDLASTVAAKFSELKELSPSELKAGMKRFIESLSLTPERKSSLFPVLKEKLLDEGCPEDDILAILEEEDHKTLEHLPKDPELLLREASSHPEKVGDLLLTVGDPSMPEVDRAVQNLEEIASSLSQVYDQEQRTEYAKKLAEFVGTVQPIVRDKLEDKKDFDHKLAEVVKKALEDLSDEELVAVVTSRLSGTEDLARPELRPFMGEISRRGSALPSLRAALSSMGVSDEGLLSVVGREALEDVLSEKSTTTGEAVLLERGTLEDLKSKIRESVEIKDIETWLGPVVGMLEDQSIEVRKRGVQSLGEMIEGILATGQPRMVERLIELLRTKMNTEEAFEVYLSYVSALEKIGKILREKGREDIAEEIRTTLSQQISDEAKRARAVEALGKVGGRDAIVSLLSALWESGIYKEVRDAIVNMGKEATPLVIEVFREAEDRMFRRRIIDLLISVGQDAVEPLTKELADDRWFVRRDVATILSRIGGPKALEALFRLLDDSELTVKKEAVQGMGRMGGAAEGCLLQALETGDPRLRGDVIKALAKVGGEDSISVLTGLLEKEGKTVADKETLEILRTLGQIGSEKAISSLKKVLQEKGFLGRPKYSDELRASALYALARIGGERVKEVLQEASKDRSGAVQRAAQAALRRLKQTAP